jgi:hypothetical protein
MVGISPPREFKGTAITFHPDGIVLDDRVVLAETRQKADKRCIIEDGYKVIFDRRVGELELYSLVEDPQERNNLYKIRKKLAEKLLYRMEGFYSGGSEEPEVFLAEEYEITETLKKLGYLE